MLKITIELIPHGDKSKSKVIGTGYVTNDGTGDKSYGNYKAVFYRTRAEQHSTVKNFVRRNSAWNLLMVALNNRE